MSSRSCLWRLFGLLLMTFPAVACAQEGSNGATAAATSQEYRWIVRLQLEPAALPVPALRYALLPPVLEQTGGNAAPLYYRAELLLHNHRAQQPEQQAIDWLEKPLAETPVANVVEWQARLRDVFEELHGAARRERCDWNLPLRDNVDRFNVRLAEVQEMRTLVRLLGIQARLRMLEGNFAGVAETLQTSFSVARHVNEVPLVIAGLVGVAGASFTTERILELVERPGSPNLYWSLTALPTPLVDLRPGAEFETSTPYATFPFLRDAENADRSAEQWQSLLEDMVGKLAGWGAFDSQITSNSAKEPAIAQTLLTGMALKGYPLARQHLAAQGYPEERIARMSVGQAIAVYTADLHNERRDEFLKRMQIRHWSEYHALAEKDSAISRRMEIIPVSSFLLPAIDNILLAQFRLDARIAELRLIEALRLYAFNHNGTLPERLANISEVPVPRNPLTGEEYAYRLEGTTALIEVPAPRGYPNKDFGKRYELTIRPGWSAPKVP